MSMISKRQRNSSSTGRGALAAIAEGLVSKLPSLAHETTTNITKALHELLDGQDELSRKMRIGMQHYLIEVAELQSMAARNPRAEAMLTTEAAAELMQCSRPYVAMLIDNKKLAGASVTEGGTAACRNRRCALGSRSAKPGPRSPITERPPLRLACMPSPRRHSLKPRPVAAPEMAVNHPLSPGGITHALLDTNFLLPPRLSDVLFDMCLQGLFSARWTVDIEAEFLRNWPRVVAKQRKGGSSPSSQQATVEQAKAARRLACYKGAVAEHPRAPPIGRIDPPWGEKYRPTFRSRLGRQTSFERPHPPVVEWRVERLA